MKSFLYLILIISILYFNSCSDDGISPKSDKIKVAAILDLSGQYGTFGKEAKIGMEMSLNNNQTDKIEIVYYDSKGLSEIALEQFNQISADTSYKVVITLTSWISNAIAPLAKEKNILHFAIGSAVFNFAENGNSIRFTGDASDESVYLTNFIKSFQSVGLVHLNNEYGEGWKTKLSQELGDKLKISKSYTDTDTDFSTILQEVKTVNPESILLISTVEAVSIIKQAKEIGITSELIGNRTILTDSLLKEPSSEGLIFSYPDLNENYEPYKEYQQLYNHKPSSFVAEGYDLVTSLNALINSNGFNREIIYSKYSNMILIGMFKMIQFDENAQAFSNYNMMIINDKKYQDYK